MNTLFFTMIILSSLFAHAFESKVSFSVNEMRKNSTVVALTRDNNAQILEAASRIFHLQLEASKCSSVSVDQDSMTVSEKNFFSVRSKNCVVKNKKTEKCDPGFKERTISENPRAPDSGIIGEEIYMICIKEAGKVSGGNSAPMTEEAAH